jgi:hypothetical protein
MRKKVCDGKPDREISWRQVDGHPTDSYAQRQPKYYRQWVSRPAVSSVAPVPTVLPVQVTSKSTLASSPDLPLDSTILAIPPSIKIQYSFDPDMIRIRNSAQAMRKREDLGQGPTTRTAVASSSVPLHDLHDDVGTTITPEDKPSRPLKRRKLLASLDPVHIAVRDAAAEMKRKEMMFKK